MRHRSLAGVALATAAALTVAGCSSTSFADDAEQYLDDYSGADDVDYHDTTCEEPASTDVGQTFPCTTIDANGSTISFIGEITAEDEYVLREAGNDDDPSSTTTPNASTTSSSTTSSSTTTTP